MIAEVGDMENVSGSRIATPLAPPRPGSTPMITPSRMPTIMTPMLNGSQDGRKAVHQVGDFFHLTSVPERVLPLVLPLRRVRRCLRYSPSQYSIGPLGSAIWK